ncbi:MAG: FHA domain-containing protein, partial [Gammaproteobacteria bacterium]
MHDPALDQIIIGRRSSSGWTGERLNINDKHMSRQHCRIYWDAGETRWMVEDLQSANGTVIGGAPVRESGPLADGMLLQMGMSMVRVEFIDEPPSHEELRRQHEEGFGEGADVEPQDATIIRSVGAFEPTGLPVESLESVDITDEPEAPSDTAFDSDGPMVHAEVDEEDAIATVVSSDEGAGSDGGPSSEAFAEDILDFSLPDDDQPAESAEATDAGGEQLDAEEA